MGIGPGTSVFNRPDTELTATQQEAAGKERVFGYLPEDPVTVGGVVNSLLGGFLTGFTGLGIGDDPVNTTEAIFRSIGGAAGFLGYVPNPAGIAGKLGGATLARSFGATRLANRLTSAGTSFTALQGRSLPLLFGDAIVRGASSVAKNRALVQTSKFLQKPLTQEALKDATRFAAASGFSATLQGGSPGEVAIAAAMGAADGGLFTVFNSQTRNTLKKLWTGTPDNRETAEAVVRGVANAAYSGVIASFMDAPPEIFIYEMAVGGLFGAIDLPFEVRRASAFIRGKSHAEIMNIEKMPGFEDLAEGVQEELIFQKQYMVSKLLNSEGDTEGAGIIVEALTREFNDTRDQVLFNLETDNTKTDAQKEQLAIDAATKATGNLFWDEEQGARWRKLAAESDLARFFAEEYRDRTSQRSRLAIPEIHLEASPDAPQKGVHVELRREGEGLNDRIFIDRDRLEKDFSSQEDFGNRAEYRDRRILEEYFKARGNDNVSELVDRQIRLFDYRAPTGKIKIDPEETNPFAKKVEDMTDGELIWLQTEHEGGLVRRASPEDRVQLGEFDLENSPEVAVRANTELVRRRDEAEKKETARLERLVREYETLDAKAKEDPASLSEEEVLRYREDIPFEAWQAALRGGVPKDRSRALIAQGEAVATSLHGDIATARVQEGVDVEVTEPRRKVPTVDSTTTKRKGRLKDVRVNEIAEDISATTEVKRNVIGTDQLLEEMRVRNEALKDHELDALISRPLDNFAQAIRNVIPSITNFESKQIVYKAFAKDGATWKSALQEIGTELSNITNKRVTIEGNSKEVRALRKAWKQYTTYKAVRQAHYSNGIFTMYGEDGKGRVDGSSKRIMRAHAETHLEKTAREAGVETFIVENTERGTGDFVQVENIFDRDGFDIGKYIQRAYDQGVPFITGTKDKGRNHHMRGFLFEKGEMEDLFNDKMAAIHSVQADLARARGEEVPNLDRVIDDLMRNALEPIIDPIKARRKGNRPAAEEDFLSSGMTSEEAWKGTMLNNILLLEKLNGGVKFEDMIRHNEEGTGQFILTPEGLNKRGQMLDDGNVPADPVMYPKRIQKRGGFKSIVAEARGFSGENIEDVRIPVYRDPADIPQEERRFIVKEKGKVVRNPSNGKEVLYLQLADHHMDGVTYLRQDVFDAMLRDIGNEPEAGVTKAGTVFASPEDGMFIGKMAIFRAPDHLESQMQALDELDMIYMTTAAKQRGTRATYNMHFRKGVTEGEVLTKLDDFDQEVLERTGRYPTVQHALFFEGNEELLLNEYQGSILTHMSLRDKKKNIFSDREIILKKTGLISDGPETRVKFISVDPGNEVDNPTLTIDVLEGSEGPGGLKKGKHTIPLSTREFVFTFAEDISKSELEQFFPRGKGGETDVLQIENPKTKQHRPIKAENVQSFNVPFSGMRLNLSVGESVVSAKKDQHAPSQLSSTLEDPEAINNYMARYVRPAYDGDPKQNALVQRYRVSLDKDLLKGIDWDKVGVDEIVKIFTGREQEVMVDDGLFSSMMKHILRKNQEEPPDLDFGQEFDQQDWEDLTAIQGFTSAASRMLDLWDITPGVAYHESLHGYVSSALRNYLVKRVTRPVMPHSGKVIAAPMDPILRARKKSISFRDRSEVPEGKTRLYRVEVDPKFIKPLAPWKQATIQENNPGRFAAQGRWFTSNIESLEFYLQDIGLDKARVVSVDIDAANIESYRVSNIDPVDGVDPKGFSLDPANEFFLPSDLAETKKVSSLERTEIPGIDYKPGFVWLDDSWKTKKVRWIGPKGPIEVTLEEAWRQFNDPSTLKQQKQAMGKLLEFAAIRVPSDSLSGTRTLTFGGFTGRRGAGGSVHNEDMIYLGGMDLDIDSFFIFQNPDERIMEHFRENQKQFTDRNGVIIDSKPAEDDANYILRTPERLKHPLAAVDPVLKLSASRGSYVGNGLVGIIAIAGRRASSWQHASDQGDERALEVILNKSVRGRVMKMLQLDPSARDFRIRLIPAGEEGKRAFDLERRQALARTVDSGDVAGFLQDKFTIGNHMAKHLTKGIVVDWVDNSGKKVQRTFTNAAVREFFNPTKTPLWKDMQRGDYFSTGRNYGSFFSLPRAWDALRKVYPDIGDVPRGFDDEVEYTATEAANQLASVFEGRGRGVDAAIIEEVLQNTPTRNVGTYTLGQTMKGLNQLHESLGVNNTFYQSMQLLGQTQWRDRYNDPAYVNKDNLILLERWFNKIWKENDDAGRLARRAVGREALSVQTDEPFTAWKLKQDISDIVSARVVYDASLDALANGIPIGRLDDIADAVETFKRLHKEAMSCG